MVEDGNARRTGNPPRAVLPDDLPLGGRFDDDIVAAIDGETGGFIRRATKDTLKSKVICDTAPDRAKRDPSTRSPRVFVELTPSDYTDIARAIGPGYAKRCSQAMASSARQADATQPRAGNRAPLLQADGERHSPQDPCPWLSLPSALPPRPTT